MTGELREAEVNIGVMGILFQIGGLCYMIPLGLQGMQLRQMIFEISTVNDILQLALFDIIM